MKKKNGKQERNKVTATNLFYIIGLPIILIAMLFFMFTFFKNEARKFMGTYVDPAQETQQVEENKYKIEEIINGSIEQTLAENNLTTEPSSTPELEDNPAKENYKNFTLGELLGKDNEEKETDEDKTMLEKDLSIQYLTATYNGITKDGALVLDVDNETKYIYLIGVENLDVEEVYYLLDGVEKIYIEYDITKKKGDGEQAYLWIDTPNNSHKENMLNVIVLENDWGDYIDPFPNIKYTYYLCKIQ